jgi:hypothetical protein
MNLCTKMLLSGVLKNMQKSDLKNALVLCCCRKKLIIIGGREWYHGKYHIIGRGDLSLLSRNLEWAIP